MSLTHQVRTKVLSIFIAFAMMLAIILMHTLKALPMRQLQRSRSIVIIQKQNCIGIIQIMAVSLQFGHMPFIGIWFSMLMREQMIQRTSS